ncbi:hypothetical protein J6590_009938 [Homalodisca vitripennis]|nr:hypothetical protein J6590_009938 [Homalodisca vitripennis]
MARTWYNQRRQNSPPRSLHGSPVTLWAPSFRPRYSPPKLPHLVGPRPSTACPVKTTDADQKCLFKQTAAYFLRQVLEELLLYRLLLLIPGHLVALFLITSAITRIPSRRSAAAPSALEVLTTFPVFNPVLLFIAWKF